MLINAGDLARWWGLHPDIVIHVGAHEAEELAVYQRLGWGSDRTIWMEALPHKAATLRERLTAPPHEVVEGLLWDKDGEDSTEFFETNNGESSSALPLAQHTSLYPEIRVTKTHRIPTRTLLSVLEDLQIVTIDLLALDVQGAELRVLQGCRERIQDVRWLYCEVSILELYSGAALLPELDGWLAEHGFRRVDWQFIKGGAWGDALYAKTDITLRWVVLRRLARRSCAFARHVVQRAQRLPGRAWRMLNRRDGG